MGVPADDAPSSVSTSSTAAGVPAPNSSKASCGPALSVYPQLNRVSEAAFDFLNTTSTGVDDGCGGCGKIYQSCCVAYQLAGHPCECSLNVNGDANTCGDCGCAWEWCCRSDKSNPLGNCKCPIG